MRALRGGETPDFSGSRLSTLDDYQMSRPTIAITMGDVAGIGPEVVVRACSEPRIREICRPLVVGHPRVLSRAIELVGSRIRVVKVDSPKAASDVAGDVLACWNPSGDDAADLPPGVIDARAGRAAYDYLIAAARAALAEEVDAVATAPA